MKTIDPIQQDLNGLEQHHYYSEDYELEWASRFYFNLRNFCLHALHELKREAGMEALENGIALILEPAPAQLASHLNKIFNSKSGSYNPFTSTELEIITALVP